MMVFLVLVGIVTVIGVVIIAVIETRRMDKGEPSLLSSITKKAGDKGKKEH